ncbi:MAG: SMC-Scp complex subunit ScpB [Armatimonadetes bacterium]|nr:SMC-Scp complex subunit ScpB [Armatimonadota bacterium]
MDLLPVMECLLFVSSEPLTPSQAAEALEIGESEAREALKALQAAFEADRGMRIIEVAGGFQMVTRLEFSPYVTKLLRPPVQRLSKPALETLAIIAYRQPITQPEIEAVRGVNSDGVLKTLLDRRLIEEAGRKQTPGRPILYKTTQDFLQYFGLNSLDDLPAIERGEESPQTLIEGASGGEEMGGSAPPCPPATLPTPSC